jgi:hypothetical protein
MSVSRIEQQRRDWTVACVGGDTDLGFKDWLHQKQWGVGAPTPKRLHTPPYMADNNDGLFIFHDVHLGKDYTLEVVPQLSGNVEFTTGDRLFTLSLFDRVNLLQALLHEFHYGPEIGGPADDQD